MLSNTKTTKLALAIEGLNLLIPLPDSREISYNYKDHMKYRQQVINNFVNAILEAAGVKVP